MPKLTADAIKRRRVSQKEFQQEKIDFVLGLIEQGEYPSMMEASRDNQLNITYNQLKR
jgi:hypothetical protein